MLTMSPTYRLFLWAITFAFASLCFSVAAAQSEDIAGGETDPIKLFERGQNAQAKGDLNRAVLLYEEAIKLRPEFPEAEFQRGVALVFLRNLTEAEKCFRRAIELRKDWALPYSALGDLLARRGGSDQEAEPLLRRALQLGAKDFVTLDSLSTVRLRAGDREEALALAMRATDDEDASAFAWAWRGAVERATGNRTAAKASLDHALQIEPNSVVALRERAELRADADDREHAIEDLNAALAVKPGDREISLRLAKLYELTNQTAEARRIYKAFGYQAIDPAVSAQAKGTINVVGAAEDIAAANNDDRQVSQPALERLISTNPKNAALLARLGEVLRTSDPQKSLDCYAAANAIDPSNPKYATGYAAALIQSRRFAEAVPILRSVIARVPDDYASHANLALALQELKRYADALPQWEWVASAKPDIAATYFYIAIAHDNLQEYPQALDAYEKYLAQADATKNQLEIEKVNLRLPILRSQIKRGQGVKPKKP